MLKELPVYKQGELDFACGLYALFTIAEFYGAPLPDGDRPLANLVGEKEEALKAKGAWKSRLMPLVWGVGVEAMEKMACQLKLECSVLEPAGNLDALKDSYLSIALVLARFDHPLGYLPSYEDSHYVVVQSVDSMFYLADSHPWMPHMRPINDSAFMTMWTDKRLDFPGWALSFAADQPVLDPLS